ncbi:MAG: anthranilate/aminodeoxychorismate synthase component II [Gemmatimonadales bacterium]|nr:anthranilate/aminodeoxychorismate synthase component II [Gemmatimonadales bacterium]NIN11630.1 anthranilate/aminodeoxychorismate synthase component II [Gemmatimonadales bacterium]NIN50236.1 anthranilate/aminodeoxychorismate synthase component II [Gemmatimonadales bacterium]NIP07700.1 anthranilate/aminodeoxychorismate synthase component II [Gemmatimonadales bacterium]NIR01852.1 anthranilate/aminodeoxychorismate synthase component II [Gemmatimonadales bacterium]
MIFVLDNYDSFTYNLVQYLGELGADLLVRRNDEVTVDEVGCLSPAGIVISPGPGVPEKAGISVPLVRTFAGRRPILGVCLGHQAVGVAFGARIVPADRLMHGKMSPVEHTGTGVFRGVPSPLTAMRYHSLLVEPDTVPTELEVTAWTADKPQGREIMGIQHRGLEVFGVQFHPESIGTAEGKKIVANFLEIVG